MSVLEQTAWQSMHWNIGCQKNAVLQGDWWIKIIRCPYLEAKVYPCQLESSFVYLFLGKPVRWEPCLICLIASSSPLFGGFLLQQRLDRRNWFQPAVTWDLLKWQEAGWFDLHVFLFSWVVLFLLYLSSFNASFCLDIFRNKLKVFSYLRMWASKSLSEALAEASCLLFFRVSGWSSIFNA